MLSNLPNTTAPEGKVTLDKASPTEVVVVNTVSSSAWIARQSNVVEPVPLNTLKP